MQKTWQYPIVITKMMRAFLIEMFSLNQEANLKMVSAIRNLSSPEECLRHLGHLANCQYKWLDRIEVFPEASWLDWWIPVYTIDELPSRLVGSSQRWISYLENMPDSNIESFISYVGHDGSIWQAELKDIALQLTFHSFHHRAQIQMIIRSQGHTPEFIDYIGYKSKKTETS